MTPTPSAPSVPAAATHVLLQPSQITGHEQAKPQAQSTCEVCSRAALHLRLRPLLRTYSTTAGLQASKSFQQPLLGVIGSRRRASSRPCSNTLGPGKKASGGEDELTAPFLLVCTLSLCLEVGTAVAMTDAVQGWQCCRRHWL